MSSQGKTIYSIIILVMHLLYIMLYNDNKLLWTNEVFTGNYNVKMVNTIIFYYTLILELLLLHYIPLYLCKYYIIIICIIYCKFLFENTNNKNLIKTINYLNGNYDKVKNNGLYLQYVKKQTYDICKIAVEQNGMAIQYVNKEVKSVNTAISINILYRTALLQNKNSIKFFDNNYDIFSKKICISKYFT